MRAGWVAGAARARALLERRLGTTAIAVARARSVESARPLVVASGYGHRVGAARGVGDLQRAVFETLLWHLRILAGWLPPGGAELMRALAAPFEIANVEDRLAWLGGGPVTEPFVLGALATAWPRLRGALSAAELRAGLAGTPWGDPGGTGTAAIGNAMLGAWARRLESEVPEAAGWAATAFALQRAVAVEAGAVDAAPAPLTALQRRAVRTASGPDGPRPLWLAELGLWRRIEEEARDLLRSARRDRAVIVGCAALLAVDAWRTATAFEGAARGGSDEIAELIAWA